MRVFAPDESINREREAVLTPATRDDERSNNAARERSSIQNHGAIARIAVRVR
jgi:hypothetical protein